MRFWVKFFALGFYSGVAPFAPGTFGTLAAAIFLFLLQAVLPHSSTLLPVLVLFFCVVGVWSSQQYADLVKKKDPSEVVIDEWAGYYFSYFLALFFLPSSFRLAVEVFLAFRFFDILKPFPVNISQKLKGGWGIMIDDLLAAVYASLLIVSAHKLWSMFAASG